MKREEGITLVEMIVAVAIMAVVTLGGIQAYQFFMGESKKELKKLDDIAEFTLFAKDVAKLAEGAGISTYYLNYPIRKSCGTAGVNTPCVAKLNSKEEFLPASNTELPGFLRDSQVSCLQFYRDAHSRFSTKEAFPGKEAYKDIDLKFFENFVPDKDSHQEDLYATWPLMDANSSPFIIMKRRNSSTVLNMLSDRMHRSIRNEYTFYRANGELNPSQIEGYPFLIYSGYFIDQYTVQVAAEVISCQDPARKALCKQVAFSYHGDSTIKMFDSDPDSYYPNGQNIYMIKFKPVNMQHPFFAKSRLNQLPAGCTTHWDDQRQNASSNFYLFPTRTMSIQPKASGNTGGWTSGVVQQDIPLSTMAHFYELLEMGSGSPEGIMIAVPIDIVSYEVEEIAEGDKVKKNLVASIYSEKQEVNRRVKIHNLRNPFYFARKLGTQELSIWYNPK